MSSVRGMNKMINADSRITDRFIFYEGLSIANTLIKQEENKRNIYILDSFFKVLNRVDLIDVDTIEACGIDSDCKIKRTKDVVPEILDTSSGRVVKSITSLDGSTEVTIITENSFARKLRINDKHAKDELWAFFRGDHIYFPNVIWPAVRIEAAWTNPEEIDNLNNCDGGDITCTPAFDRTFPIPNYLEDPLKKLLNESLLRYYHQLREDPQINKNPQ